MGVIGTMITSAAVRAQVNGEENIFKVMRHCDFFHWMKQLHCNYHKASVEQGFIYYDPYNEHEIFLNRVDAFKMAQKCGQIDKNRPVTSLFSEDLW